MAIGPDFEARSALQLRCRALERRVRELEEGGGVGKLKRELACASRSYEAKLKERDAEIGALNRAQRKMRKAWFEVFEQVEHERDEAVAHAQASVRRMEQRALHAERGADELASELAKARHVIAEQDARIAELEGRIAKLAAQANRDFLNSSIPSSAQGPGRKRVPNTRKPTGRRPGAQPGHPHHPRKRPEPTGYVELPDPEGFAADPDLYKTSSRISKVVVSARVAVEAIEHSAAVWRRRPNGSRLHAPFPEGVSDEVVYDASVKALAFLLTQECCASAGKARAFLREASGGTLDLSRGMISALAQEFSLKSGPERDAAVAALMSAPALHADFTGANVGGKASQVLILANRNTCALLARKSKGHKGVKDTPLERYAGCVVHDHDTTFYSYGTSHQECMQHNVRHLRDSTQNEPHLIWNKEMLGLVREMVHWRNGVSRAEAPPGDEELAQAAEGFRKRYREALELAEREYAESPPTKYYRDGYNLFLRLRNYADSELRFLDHPGVAPENSACERLARVFKRKQHQAIAFRSFKGLGCACESISAVTNMRMAGKDVFAETSAIFNRAKPPLSSSAG